MFDNVYNAPEEPAVDKVEGLYSQQLAFTESQMLKTILGHLQKRVFSDR